MSLHPPSPKQRVVDENGMITVPWQLFFDKLSAQLSLKSSTAHFHAFGTASAHQHLETGAITAATQLMGDTDGPTEP